MSDYQYLSIKQIVESSNYPFSHGQMRHFLNMRHKNGLENAIRKIGKGIYLRKGNYSRHHLPQIESYAKRAFNLRQVMT